MIDFLKNNINNQKYGLNRKWNIKNRKWNINLVRNKQEFRNLIILYIDSINMDKS